MTALILLSEWNKSQIEFWMPVDGYPGYDVSNFGRVRSYWHKIALGRPKGFTYVLLTAPVILEGRLDRDGYRKVSMRVRQHQHVGVFVHRLVALAFLRNHRPHAKQVNHINNVHGDNRVNNLEWCTHRENQDHAILIGVRPFGEQHGMARLTVGDVQEIRRRCRAGEKPAIIAPDFEVTPTLIYRIRNYQVWKSVE